MTAVLVERLSDLHRRLRHSLAVAYDMCRRAHTIQDPPALFLRRIFIFIVIPDQLRIGLLGIHIEDDALAVRLEVNHPVLVQ